VLWAVSPPVRRLGWHGGHQRLCAGEVARRTRMAAAAAWTA